MFRFRLARVLQHRRRQRDEQARRVAAAAAAVGAAEIAVTVARQAAAEWTDASARRRGAVCRADELTAHTGWLSTLRRRVAIREAELQQARAALAAAQARLVEAHRAQEVLERLEVRQREEWRQEEARRERRELDEVAQIRAAVAGRQDGPDRRA